MSGQNSGSEYLKEKFEFALEVSNFGFWEFYVETNDTIRTLKHDHIFGYSTPIENWTYETFLKHVYPKDKDRVDKAFKEFVAEDKEYMIEFRIVRADMAVRWIQATAKKIINKKGEVVRIIGLTKEVTYERNLKKKKKRIQNIFNRFAENANIVLFKASPTFNKVTYLNREIETILGVSFEYLAANPLAFIDFVMPEDKKKVKEFHGKQKKSQNSNKFIEYQVIRPSGEIRNIYENIFPEINPDGKVIGFLGTISDLTDVYLEKKLKNIRIEVEGLMKKHDNIEEVCKRTLGMLCRHLMFDCAEILLLDSSKSSLYRMVFSYPEDEPRISPDEGRELQQVVNIDVESVTNMLKNESPFFLHSFSKDAVHIVGQDSYLRLFNIYGFPLKSNNEIIGFLLFYTKTKIKTNEEISKVIDQIANQLCQLIQKNYMQDKMAINARYDSLTGLPNRNLFVQTIKELISKKSIKPLPFSLVKIQIDRFDEIDNVLDPKDVGSLLKQFVDRLASSPSTHLKYLSRLDVVKFGLIFEGYADASIVENIAKELLLAVRTPFVIDKQKIFITVSIGISFYPQDGQDEITLLNNVSSALSNALEQGGNCFVSWNALLKESAANRLKLNVALNQALVNNEFVLYYQPKIDFKTGKTVGVEALTRWMDPNQGIRLPDTFFEVAEQSDLIVQIGEWVLRNVCTAIINNSLEVPIALNLSINQFKKKNQFLKMLSRVLNEFKIDYNKLEFEITESILMNGDENISILKSIQKMGIKISFDDFGIGYSSFNYLKYFTPNRVKLDKSFIDGIPNVPSSVAIVKAIITLCKSLDIKTTAEGAETEEQLRFLMDQGCDEVQSFYFSHPLPILEASKIIGKDFKDLLPHKK